MNDGEDRKYLTIVGPSGANERAAKAAYMRQKLDAGEIDYVDKDGDPMFEDELMTVFTAAVTSEFSDYRKDVFYLIHNYAHAPDIVRQGIDAALVTVCGWSLGTLCAQALEECKEGEEPNWNHEYKEGDAFFT